MLNTVVQVVMKEKAQMKWERKELKAVLEVKKGFERCFV